MWESMKQVVDTVWRLLRGKELVDLGNPFEETKVTSMYYQCWGCGKSESFCSTHKPAGEELIEFWKRWGTVEDSLKIIFLGDGSYQTQAFCPACQEIIRDKGGQYRFGYLASELAPLLRGSQENKATY